MFLPFVHVLFLPYKLFTNTCILSRPFSYLFHDFCEQKVYYSFSFSVSLFFGYNYREKNIITHLVVVNCSFSVIKPGLMNVNLCSQVFWGWKKTHNKSREIVHLEITFVTVRSCPTIKLTNTVLQ